MLNYYYYSKLILHLKLILQFKLLLIIKNIIIMILLFSLNSIFSQNIYDAIILLVEMYTVSFINLKETLTLQLQCLLLIIFCESVEFIIYLIYGKLIYIALKHSYTHSLYTILTLKCTSYIIVFPLLHNARFPRPCGILFICNFCFDYFYLFFGGSCFQFPNLIILFIYLIYK